MTPATTCATASSRNCSMWTTSFTGELSLDFFSEAVQRMQGLLEYFQFETRCVSNHTA